MWVGGTLYFGTGRRSRKGRNLAANLHVRAHLKSGDDVVIVEGVAEEATDRASFAEVDAVYRTRYGMGVIEAGGGVA